jgi:hypothetical protein
MRPPLNTISLMSPFAGFPLHSTSWVEHVERAGYEVIALDGDHWVPKQPAFTESPGRFPQAERREGLATETAPCPV